MGWRDQRGLSTPIFVYQIRDITRNIKRTKWPKTLTSVYMKYIDDQRQINNVCKTTKNEKNEILYESKIMIGQKTKDFQIHQTKVQ